jgi:hypothetical protein
MRSNDTVILSPKRKLALGGVALVGVVFVLLTTSHYGIGLTPDSATYIGTARHLVQGLGFIGYDGSFPILYAPLYSVLLAWVGLVFRTDPLLVANVVNAILFGGILYLSGVLIFRYLPSSPILAWIGIITILFSMPVFAVSIVAWSEALFIGFVLLSLVFVDSYLSKKDQTSLILLAVSIAFASLTRYIGALLIPWGGLLIIVWGQAGIKNRIRHLLLFTAISTPSLAGWAIHNYLLTGTFFGSRPSSIYTLSENILIALKAILNWYMPIWITDSRSNLLLLGAVVGIILIFSVKNRWQSVKITLRQSSPLILLVIIYVVFLIVSSTMFAYDQIDDRLLSPVNIPITLLIFILIQTIMAPYSERFSKKIVNSFLIIAVAICLIYPIRMTLLHVADTFQNGQGYASKVWIENEMIPYLRQHPTLEAEGPIYTNDPSAIYLLTQFNAKISPAKTQYHSFASANDLSQFKSIWPPESRACLVWFDRTGADYLFSPDELLPIVNLKTIVRLQDGTIYSLTGK